MDIILHLLLTVFLLCVIVYSCIIFTNAIEYLGKILNLGEGALGSVFAAIGTALPETIVPLVAIVGGYVAGSSVQVGSEIGIGAILGSIFLLSTLAMSLVGFSILFFSKMKLRSSEVLAPQDLFLRDFKFLILSYTLAISAAFVPLKLFKILIAVFLICYYVLYAYRTIAKACNGCEEGELEELLICKIFKNSPCKFNIVIQIIFSLTLLIVAAHFFVEEIKYFSVLFKINPLILSLIISPVATELPEITNSIIWTKKGKDTLALGNITGAMVFQSTIPMAIGILLTPWVFGFSALANITIVFCAFTCIVLSVLLFKKITIPPLIWCGMFYLMFVIFIYLTNTFS